MQQVLLQDGGVQKGAGGARIHQRQNGDGKEARDEKVDGKGEMTRGGGGKVDGKGEMTRGGGGEGTRERENTPQPGPYWLGREFFG